MLLKIKNVETVLYAYEKLTLFEIATEDKVFYPANAKIVHEKNVLIQSYEMPNLVAIRHACRNCVTRTL